ncbi:unnamed protein product [Durusdinium trenchii]|uniref:Plastid lipid-associated protein/fibrillin conserved domain-containing protein n=1 Tax=Durusdinium trenchii TaxID=1381693 RepID=A0ABP0I0J9_9DINO
MPTTWWTFQRSSWISQQEPRTLTRGGTSGTPQVLSALPGLAVLTPKGQGLCQTVNAEQISVVLDGGEVVRLDAGDVQCPVAKTWPLVSRFLDAAAALLRLHSGTLARLAEAFRNLGLEQLQEQTLSKASQAAGDALKLWDEWEAKEAQEVAQVLKSHADEAMPKLRGLVDGLVSGLNQLLSRASFDGQWVGKEDGEARCTIRDAVVSWHWGEESELEIWSETSTSTLLSGEIFRGTLRPDGCLTWNDGDVWRRVPPDVQEIPKEDLQEESMDGLPQLHESLAGLRGMLSEGDLNLESLDEAMECLSKIAQTASADEDVKALASNLEEEMQRFGREQLQWIQQELAESKAGHVLLQGQKRLQEQLSQLQETAITPQLDAMHERSRRFLMRLATDRKVKSKASQLFGVVEKHLAEKLPNHLEEWVQNLRSQVVEQLGFNRAMLVEGLKALPLSQEDLRKILVASWDQTSKLEAQLESSILDAMSASGLDLTGTELLDCFEGSASFSSIPALQDGSGSLLSLLTDLGIEIPSALHQLLKAQAEGRVEDVETWKAALKSSLDDEVVVKGATGLVEHGEMMVAKLQELGENQAVARVVEQLQSEEIEREVLKSIRNFDPEKVLSTAEEALSNLEAREALVNHLKDTCLDLILKILPSIHIDQVNGNENDCDWEISNINFSDFSFRKEDVHVTLNELNAVDEEVLCIRASGISAHFRDLKINLKSTFTAACIADAKAEQMSLDLAFRWAADQKPPRLVMSSRAIKMENLDLYVHETDWSVSTLVNALSYLFAATLNRCACEKIESKLDEHVGIVVEGLNQCLVSCAPLLDRMGFQDFLKVSTKTLATPTLRSEDDGSWRPSDFLKAAFEAVTNDNIITTGAQVSNMEPSLSGYNILNALG